MVAAAEESEASRVCAVVSMNSFSLKTAAFRREVRLDQSGPGGRTAEAPGPSVSLRS